MRPGLPQDTMPAQDVAVIGLDRLRALATLLADEEGASQFAGLGLHGQVAIFGLFEDLLAGVRTALTGSPDEGGPPGSD